MRSSVRSWVLCSHLLFFSIVNAQSSITDSIFHPDSLRHIVEVLAADNLKGRFTGTPESLKAAQFIAGEFKKAGLSPLAGNDGFFQEIKPGWFNVMAAIKGNTRPGQLIIFSAHYDHVGTIKTNPEATIGSAEYEKGDSIYNGANDNASGVAAIIRLAKYFKSISDNERTLLFVAFTGEELGLLGSNYLADKMEADSIIAIINIEMIGRSEQRNPKPFLTGSEFSDLRKLLNRDYQAYGNNSEKEFFKIDPHIKSQLFIRSDNYPFALKGVPAHSVMLTPAEDKYYHNPGDETWTLDFEGMKKITLGIAYGVTGLIKGIDTPKRIKNIY